MIDPWYFSRLVCPRDFLAFREVNGRLHCPSGHSYPVVRGVPVMLDGDVEQTIGIADQSWRRALAAADRDNDPTDLFLDTISISDAHRAGINRLAQEPGFPIDPVVAYLVGPTNGIMYQHLIGTLRTYPIPDLPMPAGKGELLVDIGCAWGRWSIAAARKGYDVVGVDPSLGAVLAARRVANALRAPVRFIVGDARFLPFPGASVDHAFSFSVLQHLSESDTRAAVSQIARILKDGGSSVVQMPTRFGIRCLYHQARRGFRQARAFEVRYRTIGALRRLFGDTIGPTTTQVHCYFGIGLQASDAPLMPVGGRIVLQTSERLTRASRWFPPLKWVADSVYVRSTKVPR